MIPTGPAVVMVMEPPQTRMAALVYRTPAGLAWIEPGYFDEEPPPRSQLHEFDGEVINTENGVLLRSETQQLLILDAELIKGTDMDTPQVRADVVAFYARLAELGTTLEEQRIILASQVGASG